MEWINTLTFLLLSYQLLPKAKSALEVLPKYSLMDVYLEWNSGECAECSWQIIYL